MTPYPPSCSGRCLGSYIEQFLLFPSHPLLSITCCIFVWVCVLFSSLGRLQQWRDWRPLQNHQARHVLCLRSGYRSALLRMQASNTVYSDATGNGALAFGTHSSHHRQQHRTRPHNGQYDFKSFQVQRHEVSVVEIPQSAADVCIPMGMWAQ